MHVAETFKVLIKNDNNLFEKFTPEEFRVARRRMIKAILATDMSKHAQSFSELKHYIESFNLKNNTLYENEENIANVEKVKEMILCQAVHAADVSNPAKKHEIFNKWVELLYIEFFTQGDKEREAGLAISNLCDRNNTNIYNSSIGFINFVTKPLFSQLVIIMPEIGKYLENMEENLKKCEEKKKTC